MPAKRADGINASGLATLLFSTDAPAKPGRPPVGIASDASAYARWLNQLFPPRHRDLDRRPAKPGRPPVGIASDALGALTEPSLRLPVEKNDRVLAGCQDDIEVAPVDRLLRPPAVDDAPLLTHQRDRLPVHAPRRSVDMRLDKD